MRRWFAGLLRILAVGMYDDGLPRGGVEELHKRPDNEGKPLSVSVSIDRRRGRHGWVVMHGKCYVVARGWGSTHVVALRMAEDAKTYLDTKPPTV